MKKVFNYLNYREFLEDYYLWKKQVNPHFSYQLFADKAGFKSRSFLKLVIDGKKNLSEKSLDKIQNALELPEKEWSYFCDLVFFNQAKKLEVRNSYFQKLMQYNPQSKSKIILQNKYDFYEKWYHNTIREIVTTVDIGDDFDRLAKLVKPRITARMARLSVQLLMRLGFIRKENGRYVQCDSVISTGDDVQSLAVQNFHVQNALLAGESIDTTPSHERDISCLVLGLSEKGYEEIRTEIRAFRKKLLTIADAEKRVDRVYHVNFSLFPTSEALDAEE